MSTSTPKTPLIELHKKVWQEYEASCDSVTIIFTKDSYLVKPKYKKDRK